METRRLELPLCGTGAESRTASVEIGVLDAADRVKRAALALGAGLALAVVALPIPIVHLILVPSALLVGLGLAARRLGQGQTFRGGEGTCPYCGTRQHLTLLGRFHLPKTVYCSSCQRELYLDRADEAAGGRDPAVTTAPPRSPT